MYVVTTQLEPLLAILPGNFTTVWIPSGISLGAVLLFGYWVLPGIALGAFLAGTWYLTGMTPPLTPGTMLTVILSNIAANTLQPLLMALLLKGLMKPDMILSRVKHVLLFVPIAGIGSMIGATSSISCLYLTERVSWAEYSFGWLTLWLAITVSHLIFTPVLLAWNQKSSNWDNQLLPTQKVASSLSNTARLTKVISLDKQEFSFPCSLSPIPFFLEAFLLLGLALLGSWMTFSSGYILACILLPLLLWSVFRLGKRCTNLLVVLISISAIIATQKGLGAFIQASPQASLLSVQSFICVFAVTSLILSAVINEWEIIETELLQAYTELRHAQSQLTQLLEAVPVGVSVHDSTGQITYANRKAKQLLGINTLPEATTEDLAEAYQVYLAGTEQLYPPQNMPIVHSLAGETAHADDLEIHQSNIVVPLEVWTTPIYNESGQVSYAIAAFQNIAERKLSEKLLEEYNRTLEAQVAERTEALAYSNQQLIQEIVEREQVHKQLQEALKEYQRQTNLLRESEERWHLALRVINGGIWDRNLKTGKSSHSVRWKEMLGYEEHELENNSEAWKNCLHPDDFEQVIAAMQAHLEQKTPYYFTEYRLKCKDGSYKWILARGQTIWDEQGNLVRIVGSQEDITERKRAEIALAESEQKYRHFVETSQDIIWSIDLEGKYTFLNQAVKHIYGYDPEEMLGRCFTNFMPTEKIAQAWSDFQKLLQGGSIFQYETVTMAKDGRPLALLCNAIALVDEQGKLVGVTGTASDITNRKQREEALRLIVEGTASATGDRFLRSCVRYLAEVLQVRYAFITEVVNEALTKVCTLAFWDGETWSDNFEYDLAGTPCENLLCGKTCFYPQNLQALFPDDQDLVKLNAQSYLGMPLIDSDGKILGHLAVLDTKPMPPSPDKESILRIFAARAAAELERQQAEAALSESEQQYRHLVETSQDIIWSINVYGRYTFVNQAVKKIYGYEPEEMLGCLFTDFVPIEQVAKYRGLFQRLLTGMSVSQYETTQLTKDGRPVELLLNAIALWDEEGNVVGLTGTASDITDLKRAETLLARQNQILEMIASGVPLKKILEALIQLVEEQSGQILCSFLLLDQEDKLRLGAAPSLPELYNQAIDGTPIGSNVGSCGTAAYLRETVIVTDIANDPLWADYRDLALTYQLKACYSKPILSTQGKVLGTFAGYYREPRAPSKLDKELIDKTIHLARIAIERQQAQAALHQSEERLQLALEGSDLGLWDWNIATGDTYFDPQWQKMLGYEVGEIEQNHQTWIRLLHPEDAPRVIAALHNYLKGYVPAYNAEFRMRSKSGKWQWILSHGKVCQRNAVGEPVRMTGTHRDISDAYQQATQRQQAEEEIRKLSAALENAVEGISRLDTQGCYLKVNKAYASTCGYQPQEMIGMAWQQTVHPEDMEKMIAAYQEMLEVGKVETEARGIRQDGSLFHQQVVMIRIFDSHKNFIGHYRLMKDITERKQAEIVLEAAKEAAETANKAKSEFLANMSHELRTPLNAILGFTQLMNRDPSLNSVQKNHLDIINRSGEHLLELINDVLQMSKIEAGRTTFNETSFDLYRLLNTLEDMLRLKANAKDLQLIFERTLEVPQYVKTDESKLRQVLINLLGNAIKFTIEGSVILRVRLGNEDWGDGETRGHRDAGAGEAEGDVRAKERREIFPILNSQFPIPNSQTKIIFEVEDTGSGIIAEEVDKLFEAFTQTATGRKSQEGTGLGLPISRKFVQLMGGDITVSSKLAQGSIFSFYIQIDLAETEQDNKHYRPTLRVTGLAREQPKYRLLVVEDNPHNRQLIVSLLTAIGFEVQEAENGQEAIELWENWQPHLILMDIRMPVMDGYEATKIIKARERKEGRWGDTETRRWGDGGDIPNSQFPNTIIIALTANAFEEQQINILAAGCDDLIPKPFQEEFLLEAIAKHLGVRYLYEKPTVAKQESSPTATPLAQPLIFYLSQMPSEWVAKLQEAAILGFDDKICQLIAEIPETCTLLRQHLMNWCHDYRFDKIIDLIQKI